MSKRGPDPIHFESLTVKQQHDITASLNLDLEIDFIVKSTSGETKIKFSDTNFYAVPSLTTNNGEKQIDGTKLTFSSSSYKDIVEAINNVLGRYVPLKPQQQAFAFKIAPLPIGISLFGKMPKTKARGNAATFGINDDKTWNEYKSAHAILDKYATKRRNIATKTLYYTLPQTCKVRLAVVIEPTETSKSPTSKSPSSSQITNQSNKKKSFTFPKVMKIDIVGPCTKTEDKNHTVKYSTGSTQVLSSFSHDLSAYSASRSDNDSFDDTDDVTSDERNLMNLHLTEFRAVVARYCLENVDAYAFNKKVIGSKSILLGSTKKTLLMEPLKSTESLQNFVLEKINKMKKNKEKELRVRLSFGVATTDDMILDILDLNGEDSADEDYRFLQMEMNEPRLKQSHQEM